MDRIRKNKPIRKATISTASLPDIVFLLLFFFMVSADIKEQDIPVESHEPSAMDLTRAEKKVLIKTLWIGKSRSFDNQDILISDGDRIITVDGIIQWATTQKSEMPEYLQDQMIVLIKADQSVKMGLIADIQQALREANTRKVIYRTMEEI